MSGFEVRNSAGALTVNSDYKSPLLASSAAASTDTVGDFDLNIPGFGNLNQLGYVLDDNLYSPGQLAWFRLNVNGWGVPGARYFLPGSVFIAKTKIDLAVESGYLDVFNAQGTLIWSAKSAAEMPRVLGFITIPPNYDLQNNTLTVGVSGTPFYLMDIIPGALAEDQEGVGAKNGIVMKQQSGSVILRYINQNGKNYVNTPLYSRGFKIPYAVFPTV
ncbi:hypothetical protein AAAW31_002307 [Cronobacter sakazakii]